MASRRTGLVRRNSTVPHNDDGIHSHISGELPLRRASTWIKEVKAKEKKEQNTKVLFILFALRLVDFLGVNMVLPTLHDYMRSVGGSTLDYYHAGSCFALCSMVGVVILGFYLDGGPGRMLPALSFTILLMIAGNLLYAIAGSVELLRHPSVLLVSRCIVGFGSSNSLVTMIFMGEVCDKFERQLWTMRYGMTRSQGVFWGPPLGIALAATTTSSSGLWGAYTVPGWFQVLLLPVIWILLKVYWPDDLEEQHALAAVPGNADKIEDGGPSVIRFLVSGKALSTLLVMVVAGTSMQAVEILMPVMTEVALGWKGPKCGSPLSLMAVLLTVAQLTLQCLTRRGVQDRVFVLIGVCLLPLCMALPCLIWYLQGGYGVVAVVGPLLSMPLLVPFCMLGTFSLWTRMVMESVPQHAGVCQAFKTNVSTSACIIGPLLLSVLYSGKSLQTDRVPSKFCAGLAVICIISGLLFWANHAIPRSMRARHGPLAEKLLVT